MLLDRSARALHFAVRGPAVAHYLGRLFLILAPLSLVPAIVSLVSGNVGVASRYGFVILVMGALGYLASRVPFSAPMQRNEALVISALVFMLPPFLLAVPLMGYGLPFVDAYFEAVSAVTTTGLSVLPDIEAQPPSLLFARAWTQWVGGFGVLVLALALMLEPGIAANHLGFDRREADDIAGGTRSHARKVIVAYGALTAVGIFAIWASGATWFEALVHGLSAVSTGGFNVHGDGIGGLDPGPRFAVSTLCLSGAVSFYVYYRIYYRKWWSVVGDPQLLALLAMCCLWTALLAILMPDSVADSWLQRMEYAGHLAVQAQSTAGFTSTSIGQIGSAATLCLVAAMLTGGGLGSTAGGIKLVRLLILVRVFQLFLAKISTPRDSRLSARLGGEKLSGAEIEAALVVILGYVAVLFISWLVFLAYGQEPLASLFEVASALGTAGLSSGLTGPDLAPELKLLLCLGMLMGRVETVALVVLLFPPTWIGKRRSSS